MPAEPPEPPPRSVTIYDVAAAAGVSPSTVSRAFSRPGRVSASTAERIRRIAADMGYRIHSSSQAQPIGHTSIIALVVADVTNPFYNEIVGGAESALAEADFTMLLANTHGSGPLERGALERVIPVVEGIVLATTIMPDSAIRMIAKQRPTVVLNRAVSDVPSIVTDIPGGTRRAVEHLAELGHHTITYAAGPEESWTDGMRWRALRQAALDLRLQGRRIGPFDATVTGGAHAADELVRHPTSAVITYNDQMAIGLIRRLTHLRVGVPDKVSVIGFDNIFPAELVTPPLTTLAAPLRAMGAAAVRTLLAMIHGAHPRIGDPTVLPVRLVVRESTAQRNRQRSEHLRVATSPPPHDN